MIKRLKIIKPFQDTIFISPSQMRPTWLVVPADGDDDHQARCGKTNVTSPLSSFPDCEFQLREVSSWVTGITQTQVKSAEQDCFNCYHQPAWWCAAILSSGLSLLKYLSSLTKSVVGILPLTLYSSSHISASPGMPLKGVSCWNSSMRHLSASRRQMPVVTPGKHHHHHHHSNTTLHKHQTK